MITCGYTTCGLRMHAHGHICIVFWMHAGAAIRCRRTSAAQMTTRRPRMDMDATMCGPSGRGPGRCGLQGAGAARSSAGAPRGSCTAPERRASAAAPGKRWLDNLHTCDISLWESLALLVLPTRCMLASGAAATRPDCQAPSPGATGHRTSQVQAS